MDLDSQPIATLPYNDVSKSLPNVEAERSLILKRHTRQQHKNICLQLDE